MDNEPSDSKEPQDSIRPKQSSIEEEQPKDNEYDINNQEMSEKIGEEMKDIKSEENEKITNEHIVDEELIESSKELKNFYSDLEAILININNVWNYNREGFINYYITEIKPKINECLTYPCITSFQDKIILIFRFLCKYFIDRKPFLKELSKEELYMMLNIIHNDINIFMEKPNNVGMEQNYQLIEERYFKQEFINLLPGKLVQNNYGINNKNGMHRYFIAVLFQSGFVDAYINDVITRDDFTPQDFINIAYFPSSMFYTCNKNFIIEKNWNVKIMNEINKKIDFYLSENNPYIKDDYQMNGLINFISLYFIDCTLAIFNFVFDDLIANYLPECQKFSVNIFRVNIFFLKHQKINLRMTGMYYISNLCNTYLGHDNSSNYYFQKYEDGPKIFEFMIKCGIDYLDKIKIFDLIFGENIHEGVIQRCYGTLSFLYKYKIFNSSHIKILWNLSQTKYQSISNAIIALFGDLLPEFSLEDCNSVLTVVDKMKFKEVNETTLKLLENFFKGDIRRELLLKILFKFSNELSYEQGLDKNIIFKSRAILVRLLINKNYTKDLFKYIKKCIFHIKKFYLVDTYLSTLTQILDYLSHQNNQNIYTNFGPNIQNFNMLISYLDENLNLFPIHMNYLVKIIQLFKFFYQISAKILNEINNGNFEYESLFNVNMLYSEYIVFSQKCMNFSYNLVSSNVQKDNEMDIELNNNNIPNDISTTNNNDIFNETESEFEQEINDTKIEAYIIYLIKAYAVFFQETLKSNNTLPSLNELKFIIFRKLKIDFEQFSYEQYISNIIRFIFINILHSNSSFHMKYLNFLYCVAQNTADIDPSLAWYYMLLNDIFNHQINNHNDSHMITDSDMQNVLNEQIKSGNYQTMSISAFETVLNFVIYVNQRIDNAVYSPLIKKFTEIKNFQNFYGFDILWNFYLYTINDRVLNAALDIIINIFELISKMEEYRNILINKIFTGLYDNKDKIASDQKLKLSFLRSLKVISVILGTKINKDIFGNNNEQGNQTIRVICKNHYFDFNNKEDIIINISREQKITNLKDFIINTVICTDANLNSYNKLIEKHNQNLLLQRNNINTHEIMEEEKMQENDNQFQNVLTLEQFKKMVYDSSIILTYKNTVLQDDFTVADYKIEQDSKLLILKGGGKTEQEYVPTEEELNEGYTAIRTIFEENLYFGEDIMKAAIIKHKGNFEEAGIYLTVPANVEILRKELEEKNSKLTQKHDDIICLDEQKINLLLEILQNNKDNKDNDITRQIWDLFSSIKYPESIINNVMGVQLDNIFNNETNKMILYLEILNSLIFDGDFCKYNKLNKEQKSNWISNFIKNENMINNIFSVLSKINFDFGTINLYKILNIFINWFHQISLKICEAITNLHEYAGKVLPEIKLLKMLNSNDLNKSGINVNFDDDNDKNKENDKFEIINNDEGINFLIILSKVKGVSIFYKLLHLVIKFNKEVVINLVQKISEFILINIMLQKEAIPKFCTIEKKNKLLTSIILFHESDITRKMVKNFLKIIVQNMMPLIPPENLETENNFFNIIFQSFINELIKGSNFNDEFCEIFSFLLEFTTNNLIQKSIQPLILKFLGDIFNLCSNLDKCNEAERKILKFETYALSGCLKHYQQIIISYINAIYSEQKKDFIEFIFDFLLTIPSPKKLKINSIKFKDDFTRNNLFNLLTQLIFFEGNYLIRLLPKIILHHKKLERIDNNKITTPFDVNIRTPEEKLIGLRNFGSTCYLNSLTQQLFMMPSFYKDLFNNFIIPEKNYEKYQYSVIYNLQLTFQNLKNGCMAPYPPNRFIKSFKSAFNGEPIQFGIQQDSDEFLSILCDNLEKEAKEYGKENFLENSFKGKISNEILSLEKEYPYYSHSEEPFFRITLDIKGHKSLEEALDAYVKGEILDGDNKYYVDKYKKKISIRKSSSLKILGNVVIIHLKRFEFDFVTFNNYKLSDYLKFPRDINFKKWTRAYLRLNDNEEGNKISNDLLKITDIEKQNLIDDNMEYILTGILVHGGSNLQSGHYYSYIMDQETGKWYQFNDNAISDYNINIDLEKECFGNIGSNNDNQYGKTAYLLFYTKKSAFRNKNLLENIILNKPILDDVYQENVNFLNMNIYLNANYFNFIKLFCEYGLPLINDEAQIGHETQLTLNNFLIKNGYIYRKVISELKPDDSDNDSVDENINNENDDINIITNMNNFEEVYNKYTAEINILMKQEKEEKKKLNNFVSKRKLIKLFFNYIFGTILPHSQNNPNNKNDDLMHKAFEALIEIVKNNPGYSLWILKQMEKNLDIFCELLFKYGTAENELNDMAKMINEFFKITFDVIYHFEKDSFDITLEEIKYFSKNTQNKYEVKKEYKSIVMRLVQKLFCDNLEKSRTSYMNNSLYLIRFYDIVKNFPETAAITINYFFTLVSLVTNNTLQSIKSESNPNFLMGNNTNYQTNNNYICILSDTILRCVTPGMKNSSQYSPYFSNRKKNSDPDFYLMTNSPYPTLPKNWEKILTNEFYIHFILFHSYSKSKEITCHLCFCDETVSVIIMKLVCEFLKSRTFLPMIEKVFNNVIGVFDLNDNLNIIRVEALFELGDKNSDDVDELERKTLFEYYNENKEILMQNVLLMLYNIAKAIENYEIIEQYFANHKNKIEWIGGYINKIKSDLAMKNNFEKSCKYIMNIHPDLMKKINENFIKKYGLI